MTARGAKNDKITSGWLVRVPLENSMCPTSWSSTYALRDNRGSAEGSAKMAAVKFASFSRLKAVLSTDSISSRSAWVVGRIFIVVYFVIRILYVH